MLLITGNPVFSKYIPADICSLMQGIQKISSVFQQGNFKMSMMAERGLLVHFCNKEHYHVKEHSVLDTDAFPGMRLNSVSL